MRLPISSAERLEAPVTLPPGRRMDATSPASTGCATSMNTMGMSLVSPWANRAFSTPATMITSGLARMAARICASATCRGRSRATMCKATRSPSTQPRKAKRVR